MLLQFPPWAAVFDGHLDTAAELGDLVTQFYPYRAYSGALFRDGVMPLWNPHVYAGAPYQANPLSALFAPATLLHAVFPSPLAWGLGFMLRAFVAGFATALLLKALGASASGALAGGTAFAFGGFILAWQGWPQADSGCMLPVACLAVWWLRRAPAPRSVAAAALAFTLPLFGGHPGIAIYVTAYAAAFAAYCYLAPADGLPSRGRFAAAFALAGVLALALAAVQLLPTLEWIAHTARSPADFKIGRWHRPAREIAGFLCRQSQVQVNSAGMDIPEALVYSGVLAVVAAFLAPLFRPARVPAFFALLFVLSLQVVYGWGPMYWITSHAPGIAAFNNWRVILTACFSLAMLAGLGLTAVQQRADAGGHARSWWALLAAAAVAGAVALRMLRRVSPRPEAAAYDPDAIMAASALLAASALMFAPAVARRLGGRAVGVAALAVLSGDMLDFAYGHVPFARREDVFPEPPVVHRLKQGDRGLYRVASVDNTMPKNVDGIAFGMYSPTGYDYVMRRALELLRPITVNELNPDFVPDLLVADRTRLLDLLNVKYVLANRYHPGRIVLGTRPDRFRKAFADGVVVVFENRRVLPRAFLVPRSGIVVEPDERRALARVRRADFDPAASVVLPGAPEWPAAGTPAGVEGGVEVVAVHANEVHMEAHAPADSVLVFTDVHYPGWRVFVDGREAPLLRADHAFKAVALGPGAHAVRFAFLPWRFRLGASISLATLLLLLALVVVDRGRRDGDLRPAVR